ncbi:P-loop NTPase family protein [Allosphingosinicella deserti]|uniref:Capsular biosynthesis protein n=1 Tax=Allosphingosinicella deserti TaxID=2116704 RepID=A0A2P7QPG0_9SPHN|nr:hypothetical protein [Sphingomonas deserti]PSJ39863.1 hypothetical protein C7I55_14995 [Sphingomonas deserti]
MNDQSPLRASGSLLERAAELYGFGLGPPAAGVRPVADSMPAPVAGPVAAPESGIEAAASKLADPIRVIETAGPRAARPVQSAPAPASGRVAKVDREALASGGFIAPEAAGSAIAEEFRIVKRQLLRGIARADDKGRNILVCSAQPNEGKTFCAINLALSLAAEKDLEVLLIDADFPKPEILEILGVAAGPGLTDALADPERDPESFVIRTDVRGLSLLPAGSPVPDVTELLSSERTRTLLAKLASPRRIILFDSPPALMASPATVLATHVGQLLMVVRADQTHEADLREAIGLLSACDEIRLLLNGTGFAVNGRRFGSYYGYGQ